MYQYIYIYTYINAFFIALLILISNNKIFLFFKKIAAKLDTKSFKELQKLSWK